MLSECEDRKQAWQIYQVSRQAGIESWIEQPRSRYSLAFRYPRVLAAADQLEDAREIAARPIPQEVIDLSEMDFPEFEAPKCPKCGTEDPVLESVEPTDVWLSETCGARWADPVAGADAGPEWSHDKSYKNGKSHPATGQLFPQGE